MEETLVERLRLRLESGQRFTPPPSIPIPTLEQYLQQQRDHGNLPEPVARQMWERLFGEAVAAGKTHLDPQSNPVRIFDWLKGPYPGSEALPPLSAQRVAVVEQELGFSLPPLLKLIYTELGNGGFGPGYGLLPLTDNPNQDWGAPSTAAGFYLSLSSEPGPHRRSRERWPTGLLPICGWGDAIYSCVDCASDGNGIVDLDPTGGDSLRDWLEPIDHTLESWLQAWLDNRL